MKGCYVTFRDIRTRFNPIFHALKISKIQSEIDELYHAGTAVTSFDYELGRMSIYSASTEEIALGIVGKREHLEDLKERHKRYLEIHEKALEIAWRSENTVLIYQSSVYTFEEVGAILQLSHETVRKKLNAYRKAVSELLTEDEADQEPITAEEIAQLSAVIDENVMYEPEPIDKSLDPLHGMYLWHREQREKEAERKRKAEMSAV